MVNPGTLKELLRMVPDALGMEWRDILNASPILQKLAMSPEGQELLTLGISLRQRLSDVMVKNAIVTQEEADGMGLVPMWQRFTDYLGSQSKSKATRAKSQTRGG